MTARHDSLQDHHAHETALINTKGCQLGGGGGGGGGNIFCGGGTKSASRMCPPGQDPLADSVRGDNNWGGTKSAMTPGTIYNYRAMYLDCLST